MPEEYENQTDLELANESVAGDESAFEEIVRRYSPRVFRFASRFFRRREQVEEAAQEVFLKAFTQLKNFEGRGSLEGWLTRITTNTCLNLLRSLRREPEFAETSALSEEENDWLETQMSGAATEKHRAEEDKMIAADLINRVLETMSADDRLVLTMIDGEGAAVKEVAELTGWTESKVKVQAFRARKKMREAVEKLMNEAKPKTKGAQMK